MAYPIDGWYSKPAGDTIAIGFRYSSPDIAAGETILSANVTAANGLNTNGNAVIDANNNEVSQLVYGGTAGNTYDVAIKVNISSGANYTRYYRVRVY